MGDEDGSALGSLSGRSVPLKLQGLSLARLAGCKPVAIVLWWFDSITLHQICAAGVFSGMTGFHPVGQSSTLWRRTRYENAHLTEVLMRRSRSIAG